MSAWYELQDLTLWSLNRELDLKLDMYMLTPGGNIVKIWQISKFHILTPPTPGAGDVREVWATLRWTYSLSLVTINLVTQTFNITLDM